MAVLNKIWIEPVASKTRFKEYLIYWLAKYRRNVFSKMIHKLAQTYIKGCENYSYNHRLNGELSVMKTLAAHEEIKTVFDVGAHHGDWAFLARGLFADSTVYSFEIHPQTFSHLKRKADQDERIKAFALGLSDQPGEIEVNYDPERTEQTTLFAPTVHGGFKKEKLPVCSGDVFCEDNSIEEIDFLKIDVEGAEHLVLKGFERLIERKKVKLIQFEYGRCNIETRFLLLDFYRLLGACGYCIGKVYPYGVDFRDYRFEDENFIGPNFLAVRGEEERLIESLSSF